MSVESPPAVFLMGPTATGKTDLAMRLVQAFDFEIVSVDSAMVFRGMNIGTAKPSTRLLERAPHRLIDILDPSEIYSAARFRADALREMRAVADRGKVPLLVGGTMLYFHALLTGLAPLPDASPEVRTRISELAGEKGWNWMHGRLREVDAQAAERIHPNDPQRLQRALEIYELTGRGPSELQAVRTDDPFPYRVLQLALHSEDRQALRRRITERFHWMLAAGFVDEVAGLRARGDLSAALPSMRCVGYRQVWSFLDGALDYDTMVDRSVIATAQLAKRQVTWLRKFESARRIAMPEPDQQLGEVIRAHLG